MRVLSIGSDERVFEAGSAVRTRQEAYAREFGHVDLVVLSKHAHKVEKSEPLLICAAAAVSPIRRLWCAYRTAKRCSNPEVVTVQDPFEIGLVGWLVARHLGVPLHVQVHTDFLAFGYANASFVNRIRVWIASFTLRRATRIRVVSRRIKERIETTYRPKAPIIALPIFVDVEKFKNARAALELEERFARFGTRLLVVARLEPEKNIELAIRAFAKAAPQDACLIIIGEGSERERLQTLAKTLNVSGSVFFEGTQDPAPYYALADLVLVPSKYEGYGLVVVEALAAGKPVLSTDVGIAREAGVIVSSEEDFRKSLKQWFENGPRSAHLKNYPYTTFDEYVRAYCDDIRRSVS